MSERSMDGVPSPDERWRAAYAEAESRTARAFEEAVDTTGFGALLARSAENVAALQRISSDVADLVLRNLRIAGRADVTRLARQLHRTEDKLERLLQEIEALRDELAARDRGIHEHLAMDSPSPGADRAAPATSRPATKSRSTTANRSAPRANSSPAATQRRPAT